MGLRVERERVKSGSWLYLDLVNRSTINSSCLCMPDFISGTISPSSPRPPTTGDLELDAKAWKLVRDAGFDFNGDSVAELVMTALKLGCDQTSGADLKLFSRSLSELRYAANTFAPFREVPKMTVFGSARTEASAPECQAAERFSRLMFEEHGFMTITGGGGGIMGAAQKGAGRSQSFGLNICLPFEEGPNETIQGDSKLIHFKYFFTRKLNFLKETQAVAVFPGGFGTLDECFEVLTLMQTGKSRLIPLVCIDRPGGRYWEKWVDFLREELLAGGLISADDFHLFKVTDSVEVAVAEIAQFYRIFRSSRWIGQRLIFRLGQSLTSRAIMALNSQFTDIIKTGEIVQTKMLKEESGELDSIDLPRLVFTPLRTNFGRIRQLIDAVNCSETV